MEIDAAAEADDEEAASATEALTTIGALFWSESS
jgi:hypothetical protein